MKHELAIIEYYFILKQLIQYIARSTNNDLIVFHEITLQSH